MKRPYYLKKRGAFWYYRLNPESGLITGENLNYYTTGCRTRKAAESFMADMLKEERETPTFRQYAEPFCICGECPHIRRVLEETGRFTQRHARIQRGRLEKYISGNIECSSDLSITKIITHFEPDHFPHFLHANSLSCHSIPFEI